MKFNIDFNTETRDNILDQLILDSNEYGYWIEIENISDLEVLENKIHQLTGEYYSLIVGFNPEIIYIDKNI